MATVGKKTVRFTQVVKRSGEPEVHTLWVAPAKDPELQRAEKAHRVMTIHASQAGGQTDVGAIGFDSEAGRGGQFLIFPKSLKAFAGARVVGIKFNLVEQPKLSPATIPKSLASTAAPSSRTAAPKTPAKLHQRPQTIASKEKARAPLLAFHAPVAEEEEGAPREDPPPLKSPARVTVPPRAGKSNDVLIREIRSALRELKAGKAVAAYQRLERAVTK